MRGQRGYESCCLGCITSSLSGCLYARIKWRGVYGQCRCSECVITYGLDDFIFDSDFIGREAARHLYGLDLCESIDPTFPLVFQLRVLGGVDEGLRYCLDVLLGLNCPSRLTGYDKRVGRFGSPRYGNRGPFVVTGLDGVDVVRIWRESRKWGALRILKALAVSIDRWAHWPAHWYRRMDTSPWGRPNGICVVVTRGRRIWAYAFGRRFSRVVVSPGKDAIATWT